MVNESFLAIGEAIAIGVRIIGIRAKLKFLKIGESVVIRILGGKCGIGKLRTRTSC